MDLYEQAAQALEEAQYARFQKAERKDKFFENAKEMQIFESIKDARAKSKTYHSDNAR